jgi:hypothetical protein
VNWLPQVSQIKAGIARPYLGGASVELAGSLIALVFIPDDALEHEKR